MDCILHKAYLSLGANIGNRKRTMNQAVTLLAETVGCVSKQSSVYETEPWGFDTPNKFLNMCVCVTTALSPLELLDATQDIEKRLGRVGKTSDDGAYHDRVIDIDILLYDDEHISNGRLIIPHPFMHERDFVMKPLEEIID